MSLFHDPRETIKQHAQTAVATVADVVSPSRRSISSRRNGKHRSAREDADGDSLQSVSASTSSAKSRVATSPSGRSASSASAASHIAAASSTRVCARPAHARHHQQVDGEDKNGDDEEDVGADRDDNDEHGDDEPTAVCMTDLERWHGKSTVEHSEQDDEYVTAALKRWEKLKVPMPAVEHVDVHTTLTFRSWLWRHKKLARSGLPPCYRVRFWSIVSGALTIADRLERHHAFHSYLTRVEQQVSRQSIKEIHADLPRALNAHPKYARSKVGREELRQVLAALAARSPSIGYVNSLSHIAAYFLLYYEPEEAFWLLCALVDIVLPPDYFTQSLLGSRTDALMIKLLVFQRLPKLHAHFHIHGIDLTPIVLKWLLTCYTLTLPLDCLHRMFDILFVEGSNILLAIALFLFHMNERELLAIDDTMQLMTRLQQIGNEQQDSDAMFNALLKSSVCTISATEEKRREVERQLLGDAYIKDLQKAQHHLQVEAEKRGADAEAQTAREKAEEEVLARGMRMYKIGAHGDAKITIVRLDRMVGEWYVAWESKRKKAEEAQLRVSSCSLHFGVRHGHFHSRPEFAHRFRASKRLAFSFVSADRSLDVVCMSAAEMDAWKRVLMRPSFPCANAAAIQAMRRRIEKKKTIKRIKAAQAGKPTDVDIVSSEDDYDHSAPEDSEHARRRFDDDIDSALSLPSASPGYVFASNSASSSAAISSPHKSRHRVGLNRTLQSTSPPMKAKLHQTRHAADSDDDAGDGEDEGVGSADEDSD